jgi:tyrosyl-tRNA synthetase
LAKSVTDLIHGADATAEAMRASEILFGGGLEGISEATFNDIIGEVPTKSVDSFRFEILKNSPILDLLVLSGLCQSKGQARKDVEGGGIYINNARESNAQRTLADTDLLFGKHVLLRKGKRNYVVVTRQ